MEQDDEIVGQVHLPFFLLFFLYIPFSLVPSIPFLPSHPILRYLSRSSKLRARVYKGIPDCVRGEAWKLLANSAKYVFLLLCSSPLLFFIIHSCLFLLFSSAFSSHLF